MYCTYLFFKNIYIIYGSYNYKLVVICNILLQLNKIMKIGINLFILQDVLKISTGMVISA